MKVDSMEFDRMRTKILFLVFVLVGKSVEDMVVLKVHWLQRGRATDFDLRVLGDIHEFVLRRLRTVRLHGRSVLVNAERRALGVHNSGVILAAHNPAWHENFRREAEMLRVELGGGIEQIYHVGSTA